MTSHLVVFITENHSGMLVPRRSVRSWAGTYLVWCPFVLTPGSARLQRGKVCLRTGRGSEWDHPSVSVVSGAQAGIIKGAPPTANPSNTTSYRAIYNLLNDFLPISSFELHKVPFV